VRASGLVAFSVGADLGLLMALRYTSGGKASVRKEFVRMDHDGDEETTWVREWDMSLPTSSSGSITDSVMVRNAPQVMPKTCEQGTTVS
jgi:hypothetical protein